MVARKKRLPHWARNQVDKPADNSPQGRWWRRLIEAAAIVAVPPAVFYVLGLVAFWISLASEHDSTELYAIWHAASLVPRTVVVGFGVEVVWRGLIAASLVATLIFSDF